MTNRLPAALRFPAAIAQPLPVDNRIGVVSFACRKAPGGANHPENETGDALKSSTYACLVGRIHPTKRQASRRTCVENHAARRKEKPRRISAQQA
jgi:hypothetical protein